MGRRLAACPKQEMSGLRETHWILSRGMAPWYTSGCQLVRTGVAGRLQGFVTLRAGQGAPAALPGQCGPGGCGARAQRPALGHLLLSRVL